MAKVRHRRRNFSLKSRIRAFFSWFLSRLLFTLKKVVPTLALSGLVLTLFLGIRHRLYADPHFAIEVLDVRTDGKISVEEIVQLSGIRKQSNLLEVNLRKVKKRLSEDPRVQNVFLERILPNRLVIRVRERRQFIEWRFAGTGESYLLDKNGKILKPSVKERENFLVIEDARIRPGSLWNQRSFPELGLLREIRWVAGEIAKEPLLSGKNIVRITIDRYGDLHFTLDGGIQILMRRPFHDNLIVLNRLLPTLHLEKLRDTSIDLRFRNPVIKRGGK